jgi:hypothetical protein
MLYPRDPGLPAEDAHARRSGPNGEIADPVVEALMLGGLGSGHCAFISQGRPLKVVGKN